MRAVPVCPAAANLFGFALGGAETWLPVLIGAGVIVYSLLTDYELGVRSAISMRTHLAIDSIAGVFLALSPWLFGYAAIIWWPHVLVGLVLLGLGLLTHTRPAYSARARTTARAET
jgi:hypothetical protein